MSDAKDWADMDKAILKKLTKPKITARKYEGNDAGSWAIFIDGKPYLTGLTKSEVPYYKEQARKMMEEKG